MTLRYSLFSGFLTREQVKEAEASLSSARHQLTDTRRLVILQVEQAAYGVSEAAERIEARKKEREASDENLRLATARYEVGAGDIIEMIDAQVQMTQADTSTIDAQYDYSVSVATLLRAVGR
jgi:outer membrane protein TolC